MTIYTTKSNISRTPKNSRVRPTLDNIYLRTSEWGNTVKRSLHWLLSSRERDRLFPPHVEFRIMAKLIAYTTVQQPSIYTYVVTCHSWPAGKKRSKFKSTIWHYEHLIWSAIQYTIQVSRFIDDRFFTGFIVYDDPCCKGKILLWTITFIWVVM